MSRFDTLKSNKESKNPFKQEKSKTFNKSSNSKGTYKAPGYKEKDNINKAFISDFKKQEKDKQKLSLTDDNFPTLGGSSLCEDKKKEKSSWLNMIKSKEQEIENQKEKEIEPIQPGWIRIRFDKKTKKIIKEYGGNIAELDLQRENQDFIKRVAYMESFYKNMLEYKQDDREKYIPYWRYDDHIHHENWLKKINEEDQEENLNYFDIEDY